MADKYTVRERPIQVSEVTTAKRQVLYEVGTAQVQSVVKVRKAGGAVATSTSTATQIAGNVFEMTIAAADLNTEGELMLVSWGTTDSNYVYGMTIVDHDPFDALTDIKTLLDTTGVVILDGGITAAKIAADAFTGAKFAPNWLAPEAYSGPVWHAGQDIQISETATALRTIPYLAGTAETQTVRVSKNSAAMGASASVAAQVVGNLYKLTIDAGDIDTLGEVAFELAGVTNTQYISGITIVKHRPHHDLNFVARRGGTGHRRFDSALEIIETRDGPTTAATVINTETRTTSGTYTDWTPS